MRAMFRVAVLVAIAAPVRAEYTLPAIEDRRVLVVPAKELTIAADEVAVPSGLTRVVLGGRLTLTRGGRSTALPVDGMWLQDRLYSTALCTGISADDPRSTFQRLRAMTALVADPARADRLVLIEVVRRVRATGYLVSYLAELDVDAAFARTFGNVPASDGPHLAMDHERRPRDAAEWRTFLEDDTRETWVALTGFADARAAVKRDELLALVTDLDAWKAATPLSRDVFVELAIRTRRLLGARRTLDAGARARLTELGSIGSRDFDALRAFRLVYAVAPGAFTPYAVQVDVDREGMVAELLIEYPAVPGEPVGATQLAMFVAHVRRMNFHPLGAKGGELFPPGSIVTSAFRVACAPYREASGEAYTFHHAVSESGRAIARLTLDGDRVVEFDAMEVRKAAR